MAHHENRPITRPCTVALASCLALSGRRCVFHLFYLPHHIAQSQAELLSFCESDAPRQCDVLLTRQAFAKLMRPTPVVSNSDIERVSQPCNSGTTPNRAARPASLRHVTSVTACQRLRLHAYSWGIFFVRSRLRTCAWKLVHRSRLKGALRGTKACRAWFRGHEQDL